MALYRPRTKTSDINAMITADTVNGLVSDARIDQRVDASRVDSLLTNNRIDQRVNAARVNDLVDSSGFFNSSRVEKYYKGGNTSYKKSGVTVANENGTGAMMVNTGSKNFGLWLLKIYAYSDSRLVLVSVTDELTANEYKSVEYIYSPAYDEKFKLEYWVWSQGGGSIRFDLDIASNKVNRIMEVWKIG